MNNKRMWRVIGILAAMMIAITGCKDEFPPSPGDPTDTTKGDPTKTNPIKGTQWRLISYQTTSGTVVNVASQKATITFGDSASVGGYTGCNQFGGECLVDTATNAMTLRNIFSTERWCNDIYIEPMYLSTLLNVASYKLTATTLHLYAANDTVAVLNYTKDSVVIPPPPPTGKNKGIFFNQFPPSGGASSLEPIYTLMGTNDRGLTLNKLENNVLLSSAPRGGRVAYLASNSTNPSQPWSSLVTIKTDGSDRRIHMTDSIYDLDVASVAISPNGKRVAVATMSKIAVPPFARYELFIFDVDGGLLDQFGIQELGATPTFSPDGKFIAFYGFNNSVEVAEIGSGKTTSITNNAYLLGPGAATSNAAYGRGGLDWSPDGRYITYTGRNGSGNERDIFIVAANGGSAPVNITNDAADEFWPVWSPDGTRIAFSNTFVTGIYQVAMTQIDPATGGWSAKKKISPDRLITVVLHDLFPQWSPNGKEVLYTSFTTLPEFQQGGTLEVVDLATRTPSTIASGVYKGFWER
ncbi:MAG: META domain-containing protein [Chlorobi bacterium CHB2]|nr:META domain-containing protein [Chlorobi bacterium CHB2]